MRRSRWIPHLELAAMAIAILTASVTWFTFSSASGLPLLTAPIAALVLFANLAPAILLLVLVGRRIAQKRAAQSLVGANGQLHVRLVAMFSMVATAPMLLMVIIASLLFQYGVDIWYSNRARQMFENTTALAQQLYGEKQQRVMDETQAMAGDLGQILAKSRIESPDFVNQFAFQVYQRELSEGAVLAITPKNGVQSLALVNPYERAPQNWVSPTVARQLMMTRQTVFTDTGGRMEAVTPVPGSNDLFLYASRVADTETLAKAKRAALVLKDYNALIDRSRKLQIQFNLALYFVSLMIIGAAVWIALNVADRLVRPVGELVDAARKVAAGDLSVRVTASRSRDEVGVLSRAFNRMTERLGEQNTDLVASNDLLDRRRALIEAVLSGVTAGVIAVDIDQRVRIINSSASALLRVDRDKAVGDYLATISPELSTMMAQKEKEAIINITTSGESRTLAVKIVRDEVGHVLTFDDITQELLDQRRAAWSDVARRVAHEIKNPLTPIQLAAERLKRRFTKEITSDPEAFERLTDTIVRQVGDLRRMVDEFSSFARMPKPVFAQESIVDIAREAMFLHEVANPAVSFQVNAPNPSPQMVCDRRQLAQALSNIVKNGVEAISQKIVSDGADGITLTITSSPQGSIVLTVEDTGIGLPVERDRIVEPYMTTREGGTGLGLAIVKKIVEEHLATIAFTDAPNGGTRVTLTFDPSSLSPSRKRRSTVDGAQDEVLPTELTRARSS